MLMGPAMERRSWFGVCSTFRGEAVPESLASALLQGSLEGMGWSARPSL